MAPIGVLVLQKIPENTVCLAATASAAKEHLEYRAGDQGRLRPRLRLPNLV